MYLDPTRCLMKNWTQSFCPEMGLTISKFWQFIARFIETRCGNGNRAGERSRTRTDEVDRPFVLHVNFRSARASYVQRTIVRVELRMERTVISNERSRMPWFRGKSLQHAEYSSRRFFFARYFRRGGAFKVGKSIRRELQQTFCRGL